MALYQQLIFARPNDTLYKFLLYSWGLNSSTSKNPEHHKAQRRRWYIVEILITFPVQQAVIKLSALKPRARAGGGQQSVEIHGERIALSTFFTAQFYSEQKSEQKSTKRENIPTTTTVFFYLFSFTGATR